MPPGCTTLISVGDIDVSALGYVQSNPDVNMSTLRIYQVGDAADLGNGDVDFTLKSPSGRVCVFEPDSAYTPC
jgi:hypothetical protein